MALRKVVPGDPVTAEQWNELIDMVNSGATGPGVSKGGAGTSVVVHQPATAQYCYPFSVNPDTKTVSVKLAYPAPQVAGSGDTVNGWEVGDHADDIVEFPIAPGFLPEDFDPFIVSGQPDLTDPPVLLIDEAVYPPSAAPTSSGGVWRGKIIDVNLHSQRALVVPVKSTLDPATSQWDDIQQFDAVQGKCCWIMGYTGYRPGQPAIVVEPSGPGLPWAINKWNITGNDFKRWCQPDGPFAPVQSTLCESPPNDSICSTGACCFSGQCLDTTETSCVALGGTWYESITCSIIDPAICPTFAVCCKPDGSCELIDEAACDALGGVYDDSLSDCADANCPQPAPCCFDDGTCDYRLPGLCTGSGGTPIADCNACVNIMGCCVAIDTTTFEVVHCDNTTSKVCDTAAVCNQPDIFCDWFPAGCETNPSGLPCP